MSQLLGVGWRPNRGRMIPPLQPSGRMSKPQMALLTIVNDAGIAP